VGVPEDERYLVGHLVAFGLELLRDWIGELPKQAGNRVGRENVAIAVALGFGGGQR
jgi:hypothetical protein